MAVGNSVNLNGSLFASLTVAGGPFNGQLDAACSYLVGFRRPEAFAYDAIIGYDSYNQQGIKEEGQDGLRSIVGGSYVTIRNDLSWPGWWWVASRFDGATWTIYLKKDTDTGWTLVDTQSGDGLGIRDLRLGSDGGGTAYLTSYAKVQIWASHLSTAALLAQTQTRSPDGTEWFYNACDNAATFGDDNSTSGVHDFTRTGTGLTIPGDSPLFNTDLATDAGSVNLTTTTLYNFNGASIPYTYSAWVKQSKPVAGQQISVFTMNNVWSIRFVAENIYQFNTDDLGVSATGWHYVSVSVADTFGYTIRIFDVHGNINYNTYTAATMGGGILSFGDAYVTEGCEIKDAAIYNSLLTEPQIWAQARSSVPLYGSCHAFYPFANQSSATTDISGNGYHLTIGVGNPVSSPFNPFTKPVYYGRGNIAYSVASGTDVSPPYPTNTSSNKISAGDKLIMFVGQKPSAANSGTVTTPALWTLEGQITGVTDGNTGGYTTTLGADTGNCNLYVYSTTALGTETGTLLVSVGTNNVCWAQIYVFKKMPTASWSLSSTTGKQTTANAAYLITGASDPGLGVNDAVMVAQVNPTDVDTPPQWRSLSIGAPNASAQNTFIIQEADSTAGNDIGGFVAYGIMQNGPTAGNPGLSARRGGTITNATRGPSIILKVGISTASFPILTFGWDM